MGTSVLNLNQNLLAGGVTKARSKFVARHKLANPARINKIKKDLFGPVDREETKKIFAMEMAQHHKIAAQRWNFDFLTEQPILTQDSKYIWERVPPTGTSPPPPSAPQVITLSSAAHVREINHIASASTSPSANSSVSLSDSDLETSLLNDSGDRRGDETSTAEKSQRLKQTKMTDFLKEKKRTNAVLSVMKKELNCASSSSPAAKVSSVTSTVSTADPSSSSMPPSAKRARREPSSS